MTRPNSLLLALCLVWFSYGSTASAADAAAAKELTEGCAGCHGADGVSHMPLTPSLAGEPDNFIQWQLVFFRSARRKSEVMGPIAETLSDEQIRDIGAYYAALPPPEPTVAAGLDALAQEGARLAVEHRCQSCHGGKYAGSGPAARLAGQREDVLLKALHDYKSGARVAPGVASMADVVYDLSDADMQALAHYMASLR